jgi:hypothetical protein
MDVVHEVLEPLAVPGAGAQVGEPSREPLEAVEESTLPGIVEGRAEGQQDAGDALDGVPEDMGEGDEVRADPVGQLVDEVGESLAARAFAQVTEQRRERPTHRRDERRRKG